MIMTKYKKKIVVKSKVLWLKRCYNSGLISESLLYNYNLDFLHLKLNTFFSLSVLKSVVDNEFLLTFVSN